MTRGSVTSGTTAPLGSSPRPAVGRWLRIIADRTGVRKGVRPHSANPDVGNGVGLTTNLSVDNSDFESVGRILARLAQESEEPGPKAGEGRRMATGFCPACGVARVAGAKFCPSCGVGYEAQPSQPIGWGLENPAGFRPMVLNPLVLWLFVVGGLVLGLLFAVYVLGNILTDLPLIGALVACPIIGAALGSWAATNLLR